MNDLELKNKGNKYFAARKYDDAARCYSEAIAKKPGVAIYYTNRALCHLKCRRFDRVCQDCRSALEIDPMQVKAHFFLGQALLESQCYDECIRHFQRAQDLAKEQKVNYGDDIAALIRVARKKRFNLAEEARITQEIELQSYLNRLIMEDRDRLLAAGVSNTGASHHHPASITTCSSKASSHRPLSHSKPSSQGLQQPVAPSAVTLVMDSDKENRQPDPGPGDTCGGGGLEDDVILDAGQNKSADSSESHPLISNNSEEERVDEEQTSKPVSDMYSGSSGTSEQLLTAEQIVKRAENYQTELNQMFAKLDDRRRKREVPDFLCGKISFDVLREPVVTPSGITYDKKDIEEHLQRVGHFDPITRTNLTVDMLVPNLAMKEVVDAFLEENEWALDY